MATHQFTIHPFSTLHGAGETGADRTLHGVPAVGTGFTCADATGVMAVILDGQPHREGCKRIVTADTSKWRGKALEITGTLTVIHANGPDAGLTVEMFAVSIGKDGNPGHDSADVGLICAEPLQIGVTYMVVAVGGAPSGLLLKDPSQGGQNHAYGTAPVGLDMLACFSHGTRIDTPDGPRQVDALSPGDLVTTLDNGSKPLRWVGRRAFGRTELLTMPELQPILFDTGVLGNSRPLLVSARHRMLLNDWRAQVYFGEDQVLIAASGLINGRSIRRVLPEDGVTYCQLLFDRHEVILAEGALAESLHPGEIAADYALRCEIEALFPAFAFQDRRAAFPIVRTTEAQGLPLAG